MNVENLFRRKQYKDFEIEVLATGCDSTLPANLPDWWLVELARQADLYKNNGDPSECVEFLAAIKLLHYAKNEFREVPIDGSTLLKYVESYTLELVFEKISRRPGSDMNIQPATLDTVLTNRLVGVRMR